MTLATRISAGLLPYLLLGCLCFASLFIFQGGPALFANRLLYLVAFLWLVASAILAVATANRGAVAWPLETGARMVIYLMVGSASAFVLFIAFMGTFAYYGLLSIPLLGLWAAAALVVAGFNVGSRIRRAYLFGNAGTLAAAVLLMITLLVVNPPSSGGGFPFVSFLLLGLAAGVAIAVAKR